MHIEAARLLFATLLVPDVAGAATLARRVVGVADDDDTLTILDSTNQQHRIRLSGIDAPEKKQPFGSRANQNLSSLPYGKDATAEWAKLDRYGRIIGKVTVNG
jgi:endonuclease YncB( thermonuclease family)